MRWRLQKHESAHELATVKFCHYFNNGKQCPYEEVGCMFNHTESEKCRFDKYCNNKLCQFKHQDELNKISEDVINFDKEVIDNSDSESEAEDEIIECDTCGSIFEKENELTEHEETGNCGYLCEPCGVAFLKEEDLKTHVLKHCTKCCEEFDIHELNKHKLSCKGMEFDY